MLTAYLVFHFGMSRSPLCFDTNTIQASYARVALQLTICQRLAMEDTNVQPHQSKIAHEADLGPGSMSISNTDVFGL